MDDLEQRLKRALERTDAPEAFEARVMRAVNEAAANRGPAHRSGGADRKWWRGFEWSGFEWGPRKWMIATAAALVLIAGAANWWHQVEAERARAAYLEAQEREAGEAAKAQLELALKITSVKLEHIQKQIERAQQDN